MGCAIDIRPGEVLLPGEDAGAFETLRDELYAGLAPFGAVEAPLLAERVINSAWRLRRAGASGGRDPASRSAQGKDQPVGRKGPLLGATGATPGWNSDEPVITNRECHAKATRALDHAYAERDRDEALLGGAIEADAQSGGALGLLARYEAGLERSLYRALHKLRGHQAARLDRAAPVLGAASTDEVAACSGLKLAGKWLCSAKRTGALWARSSARAPSYSCERCIRSETAVGPRQFRAGPARPLPPAAGGAQSEWRGLLMSF